MRGDRQSEGLAALVGVPRTRSVKKAGTRGDPRSRRSGRQKCRPGHWSDPPARPRQRRRVRSLPGSDLRKGQAMEHEGTIVITIEDFDDDHYLNDDDAIRNVWPECNPEHLREGHWPEGHFEDVACTYIASDIGTHDVRRASDGTPICPSSLPPRLIARMDEGLSESDAYREWMAREHREHVRRHGIVV